MPSSRLTPVLFAVALFSIASVGCSGDDDPSSAGDQLASAFAEEFARFPEVPAGYDEFSTDFTVQQVSPFLTKVVSHIDDGFGASDVEEIRSAVFSMAIDEDRTFEYEIRDGGQSSQLVVFAFMDDVDTVTVAVYALPALIQSITNEWLRDTDFE